MAGQIRIHPHYLRRRISAQHQIIHLLRAVRGPFRMILRQFTAAHRWIVPEETIALRGIDKRNRGLRVAVLQLARRPLHIKAAVPLAAQPVEMLLRIRCEKHIGQMGIGTAAPIGTVGLFKGKLRHLFQKYTVARICIFCACICFSSCRFPFCPGGIFRIRYCIWLCKLLLVIHNLTIIKNFRFQSAILNGCAVLPEFGVHAHRFLRKQYPVLIRKHGIRRRAKAQHIAAISRDLRQLIAALITDCRVRNCQMPHGIFSLRSPAHRRH